MTAGVYVIQFPDHVKIGQSADLSARLRGHTKAGAQQVRVLDVEPPAHLFIEEAALRAAAQVGRRRGLREEFDGLAFDAAIELVEQAAAEYYEHGGTAKSPVHHAIRIAGRRQTEVAAEVGLTWPQWQRRMRGAVPWRATELDAVARVLGVPVAQLMGEER